VGEETMKLTTVGEETILGRRTHIGSNLCATPTLKRGSHVCSDLRQAH